MKKTSKTQAASEQLPQVPTFKKSDQEDLDALNKIKEGNPRAFAHIVHKYQEILYVKIVKAVKDEDFAQDILQDIFSKVYVNISKYEKRFTFNAWLTRVAENYIVDVIRRRKRSADYNNTVELDAAFGGENSAFVMELADEHAHNFEKDSYEDQHAEAYSRIESLIHELDARDQAILNLFYLERKRQCQIAAALGLTHGAVRVRINRLKKRLLKLAGGETLVGLTNTGENLEISVV